MPPLFTMRRKTKYSTGMVIGVRSRITALAIRSAGESRDDVGHVLALLNSHSTDLAIHMPAYHAHTHSYSENLWFRSTASNKEKQVLCRQWPYPTKTLIFE